MQPRRCSRQGAFLGYRDEVPKLLNIHATLRTKARRKSSSLSRNALLLCRSRRLITSPLATERHMTDLGGLLVLSLEQAVAAPYASCKLADAGARVIKVERAEGDFARGYDNLVKGESAYFLWLNRGKQSLCLDLKKQDDLALLYAIAAEADVFIQNFAPGAAERLRSRRCGNDRALSEADLLLDFRLWRRRSPEPAEGL